MPKIVRKSPAKIIPQESDRYIGIDPGQKGGLVCLSKYSVISAIPMPESERDIWNWFDEYPATTVTKALIEQVSAMPGQGVTSMFTFGRGYGFLRACLVGHKIPFEEVRPQAWQKHYSLSGKMNKKLRKEKQRAKAQQIFPELDIWTNINTKGKQLAISDALLIAEYCRRNYT